MSLYLSRVAPRQTIEHLVHEVLQQIKQPAGAGAGGGGGADDGDDAASTHSSGTPDSVSKV